MKKIFKLLIGTLLIISVVLGLASCDVVTGWFGGSESTYELYKAAKQLQDDAQEFSVSIEWSKLGDKKNTSTVLLDYEENAFSYNLSEVKDGASIIEMFTFIDGKIYYLDSNGNKSSYTSTKKDAMDYVENTVVVKLLKPIYECEYPESWFDGIKVSEKGKNKYILMDVTENMSKHHERPDIFVPDSKCEIYLNKDGSFSYIYFKHILIDGVKSDVTVTFDWTENGNIKEPDNKNDYVAKGDFEYDKGHRPGDDNRHPCEKGEHNYVKTVTVPTCTTGGYTTYTCACGDSYVADIKGATGHNYAPVVINPTCTTGGYTTYTCECGDSYVADIKGAIGHKYVDGVCTYCGEKDPNYNPQAPDYSVGLEYTSNGDGTCYVSGIGTCTDTDIVIPAVSPAGDRVVGIGAHAFENCVNIVSVVIPEGVTYISHISEGWARSFYGCVNLERIVMPDSVTYIGAYAGETVFYNCNKLWEYDNGVFYVNNWAITYEASMITSLNQPTTKASILEIREGTIGIANQAFIFGQYKAVVIPSSVKYIDQVAFWNWGNGECVYYLGTADEWTKIYIEQDNDGVTNHTVYYYSETQPTTAGNFWHWVDGVPTIWEKFTEHVHSFDEFRHVLTPTCTSEGYYYMVCECGEYEMHTIPMTDHTYDSTGKCTWCGAYKSALDYSVGLEYTSNGDGTCYVSGIGSCTDTDIIIPEVSPDGWTVTSIAPDVFPSTLNITSVSLPKTINYLNGNEFTYNKSIKSFVVSGDNPYYASVDGNIYSKDMKTFIRYAPGSDVTSFVVPSSVNQIYNFAFESCGSLVNIVLPEGITSISFHAFMGCTSLESLIIPDGVRNIDMFAFMACRSLEYIVIPASLTSISSAFDGCDSLTTVFYGGTEGDWKKISIDSMFNDSLLAATVCYYSATEPTTVGNFWHYIDGVPTVWPAYVEPEKPYYSEGLEFTLNSDKQSYSLTGIGSCTDADVVIPATYEGLPVTEIQHDALYNCANITSISIPDSVIRIYSYAFAECKSIKNFYVDPGNKYYTAIDGNLYSLDGKTLVKYALGKDAKSFVVPDHVTCIGGLAFYASPSLIRVEISDNVTVIGDESFSYCRNLVSIVVGKSVSETYYDTFYGCTSLVEVINKSSLNLVIGSHDYSCMASYAKYIISDKSESKLKMIGDYIFYDDGIEVYLIRYLGSESEITLPEYEGGKEYGVWHYAFSYNSTLTSVTVPSYITYIGDDVFEGTPNLTYNEYDNAYYIGNESNPYLCLIKSKDRYIDSCTIHNKTRFICSDAFSYCYTLTSVVIPDSVTIIGGDAFSYCYTLTSVVIPNSVTSIGNYAFSSCRSLTSVVIPDSVTNIGDNAFYNCESLTSVVIPDSVTSIGQGAFMDCESLEFVVIGKGVRSIGNSVFSWCKKLTDVYYTGSAAEWSEIDIAPENQYLTNATIHYNYVV